MHQADQPMPSVQTPLKGFPFLLFLFFFGASLACLDGKPPCVPLVQLYLENVAHKNTCNCSYCSFLPGSHVNVL
jgi:hypothetical protein